MITIGLTGSIGMGKSTTAGLFAGEGVAVCDSDALVHDLYGDEAVPLIENAFPGTTQNGRVDRERLVGTLRENPAHFQVLEQLVHPLVQKKQKQFLDAQRLRGAEFGLLDIPLLYETGAQARVDTVVVVSCPPEIQRQRVFSRPGMSEEKFQMILARQMPDEEKRRRADFVIDTGKSLDDAKEQVMAVLAALRSDQHGDM
ncbi:dephospho-CoA kinase [Agrobacterium sp. rho-8.1]|nr:dephospho-CoA kinase [Agrobacterium sp. rho-8.1]